MPLTLAEVGEENIIKRDILYYIKGHHLSGIRTKAQEASQSPPKPPTDFKAY